MLKLLKHILSFFLLLILQISFANSFASFCFNKDNFVSRVEFSETAKSIPAFSKTDFKENHIFEPSYHDIVSCPTISYCVVYAELVEAWNIVKSSGFDDLARNTDVLDEVLKLQSKTLNGNPLDVQKLFNNGFGKTLNNLSDADKTKMLARMNEWGADKVDDLARRLGKGNYPELADDLTNPDFFKLYDDIIHDPENAIDIAKRAGDGNLVTTAKSTFFNNITQLGKDFEKVVAPALKPGGAWRDKLKALVKNKFGVDDLDSYEMFEQVQFTYNKTTGDYFVADQVFVKYKTVAGRKVVDDIIVIENKLSDITKLTDNQRIAKGINQYWTRGAKIGVSTGAPAYFKDGTIKWIRAYGSGDGKTIVDITDVFK